MKQNIRYLITILIAVFFITGCSKQPLQEINNAKSAVDSIMSEGAEKYLPEDAKKINDALDKAMEEVTAQDAKIIKSYDKAKELLAAVKIEAEEINAKLPAKKEEVKKTAITAMETARVVMDEIKVWVEKASKSKNLKADTETISAEMNTLEDSFKELQMQIEREDYLTIASRADELRDKALELSNLLRQSQAKKKK